MQRLFRKRQSGYVLILTMVMLLGIGGVVAANYTHDLKQRADRERSLHNEKVLREAKQALLQYAYNYPTNNPGRGPGRLPCPDSNDSGTPNPVFNCINGTEIVGRLPWADDGLNLYDIRDASGERLWYAVSGNFANTKPVGSDRINSDTVGTITIEDRSGAVIRDGALGQGVAAVIFAPGPAIARNGALQDRAAGPNDPANYLDLFGAVDNADFVNGTANGFVMGPIENAGNVLVNDQMIIITAEEVVTMAEKATLQAYRTALEVYDQRIDGDVGAGDHYPWLFDYNVSAPGGAYPDLNDYPAGAVFANQGRVPSIFSTYFAESGSQPIESELQVDLTLSYPPAPSLVGFTQVYQVCPGYSSYQCTSGTIDFDFIASSDDAVFSVPSSSPVTGLAFTDIGTPTDGMGRLSGTFGNDDSISVVQYFWDEQLFPNGFQRCPLDTGTVNDCNRDSWGNFNPNITNQIPAKVIEITYTINLNGLVNFETDYSTPPTIEVVNRADGTQHAAIRAIFNGTDIDAVTFPLTASYRYDYYYGTEFANPGVNGNLDLVDMLQGGELTLTMRYYPELPNWAFSNGWHDSIMMAYAANYRPDIAGVCTAGTDCLQLADIPGADNNKISLLLLGGERNWVDDGPAGLVDDLGDVFDAENANLDTVFSATQGDDQFLVICDRVGGANRCY